MPERRGEPVRKRVLLVEDDEDLREAMTMALAEAGHQVSGCGDGGGALSSASQRRPDLVLIDIDLPDMNGCDLARRLRADPRLRETLLVAISGFAAERDRDRALAAGFDDYLIKPVPLRKLWELLPS